MTINELTSSSPAPADPQARRAVILVTGIQAAGKSTIAQLLAERLPSRYMCEATCSVA
jgi:adenylylsulfate kinase-like enzyme